MKRIKSFALVVVVLFACLSLTVITDAQNSNMSGDQMKSSGTMNSNMNGNHMTNRRKSPCSHRRMHSKNMMKKDSMKKSDMMKTDNMKSPDMMKKNQ